MGERLVLFLCTGNYYRSRFAEELFNELARSENRAWRADSAGLAPECMARNPGPISRHALEGLRARGIDVEPPRLPKDASDELLARASRIIALKEAEHRPLIRSRFPAWEPKTEFWAVDDVDRALPEHALSLIEAHVRHLLAELA